MLLKVSVLTSKAQSNRRFDRVVILCACPLKENKLPLQKKGQQKEPSSLVCVSTLLLSYADYLLKENKQVLTHTRDYYAEKG